MSRWAEVHDEKTRLAPRADRSARARRRMSVNALSVRVAAETAGSARLPRSRRRRAFERARAGRRPRRSKVAAAARPNRLSDAARWAAFGASLSEPTSETLTVRDPGQLAPPVRGARRRRPSQDSHVRIRSSTRPGSPARRTEAILRRRPRRSCAPRPLRLGRIAVFGAALSFWIRRSPRRPTRRAPGARSSTEAAARKGDRRMSAGTIAVRPCRRAG